MEITGNTILITGGANNIAMIARTNPDKAFKQMNSW
jgi:short-subunit dehydrogenase involved in D-alanine esterification of teichoic acids